MATRKGPPDLMDGSRCTARAKQSGARCKRRPIPGGAVCTIHGGKAPQVQKSARERLEAGVHPSIDALLEALTSDNDNAKVRAAREFLDRCGYGKVEPKPPTGESLYELLGALDPEDGATSPATITALVPAAVRRLQVELASAHSPTALRAITEVLRAAGPEVAKGLTLEELIGASYIETVEDREATRIRRLTPDALRTECRTAHRGTCPSIEAHIGACAVAARAAGAKDRDKAREPFNPATWEQSLQQVDRDLAAGDPQGVLRV